MNIINDNLVFASGKRKVGQKEIDKSNFKNNILEEPSIKGLINNKKYYEAIDKIVSNELNASENVIFYSIHKILTIGEVTERLFNPDKIIKAIMYCFSLKNVTYNILKPIANYVLCKHDYFKYLYKDDEIFINSVLFDFLENKFTIMCLKKILITNREMEIFFTQVRKYLLLEIIKEKEDINLEVLIALSEQCFYNEYVYSVSEEELEVLSKLSDNLNSIYKVLIFSCYQRLSSEDVRKIKDTSKIKYIIKINIEDMKAEEKIKKNIDSLTKLEGDVLNLVKQQYEKNPYPRWNAITYKPYIINLIDFFSRNFPHLKNYNVLRSENYKGLIAGCGTGKELLTYNHVKNINFHAIDISTSSIAYAKRKCLEYGYKKVDFYLADILSMESTNKKYDFISSTGVLHHLSDPLKGFEVLYKLLRPKGLMKLGLYSELAREAVVDVRNFIENNNISDTDESIRKVRNKLLKEGEGEYSKKFICNAFSDFYTLSECRDLLFHVNEYRFTIPMIKEMLEKHNMEFVGFLLKKTSIVQKYKEIFPEDVNLNSLDNWHEFEEEHPNTFSEMYQFLLYKK